MTCCNVKKASNSVQLKAIVTGEVSNDGIDVENTYVAQCNNQKCFNLFWILIYRGHYDPERYGRIWLNLEK